MTARQELARWPGLDGDEVAQRRARASIKPPSNEPANSASPERTGRHRDRYRRGSADAARSRASDPAAATTEPAAVLGLRRWAARAARRT